MDTFVTNDFKHDKHKFYTLKFENLSDYKKIVSDKEKNNFLEVIDSDLDRLEAFIATHDSNIDRIVAYISQFPLVEFRNKKESLQDYFLKFYRDGREFGGLK